jgi:hypothetical protein
MLGLLLAALMALLSLHATSALASGGKFVDLRSYGYSANAINEAGDIVGNTTNSGFQEAYIAKANGQGEPGTETFLEPLKSADKCGCDPPLSTAWDLNNSDVIAGFSSNGLPGRYFGGKEAVTWEPFKAKNPSPAAISRGAYGYGGGACNYSEQYGFEEEACSNSANAINDLGELAGEGEYFTEFGGGQSGWSFFPFILPAGQEKLETGTGNMAYFTTEYFAEFEARGLNSSGRTVVWPNPSEHTNKDSSAIYPGDTPVPFASDIHDGTYHPINDKGWVVGEDNTNFEFHARLLENGSVVDLPPLPGDTESFAAAINNSGDVVGSSRKSGGCPRAVLWRHGEYTKPVDLNTLQPSGNGWLLLSGTAINDNDQIVGEGLSGGTCPTSGYVAEPYELTAGKGLVISGATIKEPTSGTATVNFAVTLSPAQESEVKVHYETQDGTGVGAAIQPTDYLKSEGELTFKKGETEKTISVTVNAAGFSGKRSFAVVLSAATGANISTPEATGKIVGPNPLEVTVGVTPSPIDVKQTPDGPEVQKAAATLKIKNVSGGPIENVKLPAELQISWHEPPPTSNGLPIKQVGAPPSLELGTIAPGETKEVEYKLQVEGDGDFDIQALVSGSEEGQTVNGLGETTIEPTSQLLIFKAALGAKVNSQTHPGLIKAGTHFLVNVHLENRSYIHRLQVDPIEPELSGNALGGEVVPAGASTAFNPTGAESEVNDSPVMVLKPRESKEVIVVVGTSASDPFATQGGGGGGTRATVKFGAPHIATVNETDEPTEADPNRVVMAPDSEELPPISIDDSAPEPPPFSLTEATWSVGKGVLYGLWGATYGTVRGIFDLAALAAKGVYNVGTGTLDGIDHMVELWTATENDPAARQALMQSIQAKVEAAYAEAPWLLPKVAGQLYNAVNGAVGEYFSKVSKAWYAGDWREALTDVADTGTNVAALAFGPAALKVAAGTLTRLAPVADAWAAGLSAKFTKIGEGLQAATKVIEPATNALRALADVIPGYPYTIRELATFFGVDAKEADWLSEFVKAKKISVVFRSRAEESIAWLKKGAMLKPYWVKAKTVSWLDVQYLGYKAEDVGRVVMRKPPEFGWLTKELAAQGVEDGTPEYTEVIERWQTREKNFKKELGEMQKWNEQKDIKGKWPWKDNGVNPNVQADEEFKYGFRLRKDPYQRDTFVPEIFNPETKKWGSITGDIDLIAITKADGSALSDAEHVQILKELRNSPLGSQHPESATWTKDGKFWFDAKKSYLVDEDLVQAGPDGVFRAVKFNEKLSDPESWTKLAYRIFWEGGYKVGPGQVP